ncbi:MurR/RpiR family transcriptional regulator [Lentibacillus cibarius]|uniref:MurR/RpiR family transcriptional regulator n=1 Tax=Lentibacillus cibarius TaxID=2583219 RepID=A0A549YF84_9BACI|nr:MurR/RpiR family transcriptional regulator [Lentibacillus cibarius]TMN21663.1 MurR/RpiR family transcriptional regulator [Lentibacillus cibarius]TRM10546.1 MurR/RpiR family transcriptional regulator [Lentibacillus cibarius]
MNSHDVYQHISEKMTSMSKSHKRIATYILENMNTVPFFTVAKLAKKVGVSEATVVRFASFLGYAGYPELQQYMQNAVKQQLTTTERLKMSSQVYEGREQGIYEIFKDDMENLQSTMEKLDVDAFYSAVNRIKKAANIYISANRSATSLGVFLHYYLRIIQGNTELVESLDNISEQLYELNDKDVVIGISFSRYSVSTINTISFAKEQGATTVVITDNLLSPLIQYADITLTASSQMPTFIDSFTAPLSLINALIVHVGKERMHEVEARLEKMENIWEQLDIFRD